MHKRFYFKTISQNKYIIININGAHGLTPTLFMNYPASSGVY